MDPQYPMNFFSLADLFERIDRYDEAYDIYRQLSSNPKHSKRALSSMRRLSDRMKSGSGESGSGESGSSSSSSSRRHTRGGSSSSSSSSSHSGSESNKMIRAAEKLWKEQNNINAAKRLLRRVLKLDSSNSRAIKLLREIDDDEEL